VRTFSSGKAETPGTDGVKRGRTPKTLQVSAGRHTIEITFAGEDPPRKQTFPVELADGAVKDIVADFTRP
jgi:hypothetical protein